MSTTADSSTARTGFTLLELVVVIILLALAAALTIPRALAAGGRAADREAEGTQRLLTAVAQRRHLSPEPLALRYDSATRRFEVLSTRARAGSFAIDAFIRPVQLTRTTFTGGALGASVLPARGFWADLSVAGPGDALALDLESTDGSRAWRIELAPGAVAARRSGGGGTEPGGPIDLDAAGRAEEAW